MRLRGYDYRTPALCHVVICTRHHVCRFLRVIDDEMCPTAIGAMVIEAWDEIQDRYPEISLDAFVVMPNHPHGIMFIEPQESDTLGPALGDLVRWFKTATTVRYGYGVKTHGWPRYDKRLWHRDSYDHILRDERDLETSRIYIEGNPSTWRKDRLHVADAEDDGA